MQVFAPVLGGHGTNDKRGRLTEVKAQLEIKFSLLVADDIDLLGVAPAVPAAEHLPDELRAHLERVVAGGVALVSRRVARRQPPRLDHIRRDLKLQLLQEYADRRFEHLQDLRGEDEFGVRGAGAVSGWTIVEQEDVDTRQDRA